MISLSSCPSLSACDAEDDEEGRKARERQRREDDERDDDPLEVSSFGSRQLAFRGRLIPS
jgi:hypothetical protein